MQKYPTEFTIYGGEREIIQIEKVIDLSKVDGLYESIRNNSKINEIDNEELKNIIKYDKKLTPNKIMEYVNSYDKEISIIRLLLLIPNYSNFFQRPYTEKLYYSDNCEENLQWIIKTFNIKSLYISDCEKETLKNIIKVILNNFNYLLSKYKKEDIRIDKEQNTIGTINFIFY